MKRALGGLAVIAALAGGAVAARGYLRRSGASGEEVVQISFDDGSTRSLDSTSIEAQEFTDLACKLLEIGI